MLLSKMFNFVIGLSFCLFGSTKAYIAQAKKKPMISPKKILAGVATDNNSSGGLLEELFDFYREDMDVLLIAEPPEMIYAVMENRKFRGLNIRIDTLENSLAIDWSSDAPKIDYCIKQDWSHLPKYDYLVSQSLLEHVVDPVRCLENFSQLLLPGGLIAIHTVNGYSGIHRFPIDTLRFNPDFFLEIDKYLPLKALEVRVSGADVFAFCQKM